MASTDPHKLKKTIITRSTHLQVQPISGKDIGGLVRRVYKKEIGKEIHIDVAKAIAKACGGSARHALVILHQVLHQDMSKPEAVCEMVRQSEGAAEREAIELCRTLIKNSSWKTVAPILKGIKEEPERIRHAVLGYASAVALGGGGAAGRAIQIIEEFEDNFFDSKKAGLIRACYNLCN